MYILNFAIAIKKCLMSVNEKMSVKEIRYFIFENYHKAIGFSEENSYYPIKHLKKRICCYLQAN